jgi:hypothetical protein
MGTDALSLGVAVAPGVAVAAEPARRSPAPDIAIGTMPSNNSRIAMIPRPQRV